MNLRELITTLDTIENKVDETVVEFDLPIEDTDDIDPLGLDDNLIARRLIESFGYKYLTEKPAMANSSAYVSNYDNIFRSATSGKSGGDAVKAAAVAGKEAGYFTKFGGYAAWAYTIYEECKDAYTQIKALPKDLEPNQQHAEVTKIVGHVVARFGLFWVGMFLGGMIATPTVPVLGTLIGMIFGALGGWAVEHLLGGTTDELVSWIVNKVFGTKDIAKPAQAAQANSKKDPEIESLQKRLVAAGAVNTVGPKKGQPLDIDGIWGPNTAAAYEEYKKTISLNSYYIFKKY